MEYKALRTIFIAGVCGLVVFSGCNNGVTQPSKSGKPAVQAPAAAKDTATPPPPAVAATPVDTAAYKIGRASCRERVFNWV